MKEENQHETIRFKDRRDRCYREGFGHGGFRKRIIEMGFIQGKQVEVLLNAPLRDPVKYKIMGYEVSLRHSEADQIEVVSAEEARQLEQAKADNEPQQGCPAPINIPR